MAWFARNTLIALNACVFALAPLPSAAAPKKTKTRVTATPRPTPPPNFHLLGEGELPLAAKGAIVIDGLTGKSLYEKNADTPQYPASTTKIMTALLVIESGNLDQEVEIADEDAKV